MRGFQKFGESRLESSIKLTRSGSATLSGAKDHGRAENSPQLNSRLDALDRLQRPLALNVPEASAWEESVRRQRGATKRSQPL